MSKIKTQRKGKVFLVGAGPGDPGLITLRGKECLEQADVVVYDNLIDPSILDFCTERCRMIYVGKRGRAHAKEQSQINRLLVGQARAGRQVVRLKGGDPFIFGRGGEEAEFLSDRGVPFDVVPGVTSAVAAPTYAGIPLTHRLHSSMVTFVTGHEDPTKESNAVLWRKLTPQGTLVILMGVENLNTILRELLHRDWNPATPAAVIQWGTFPNQRVLEGSLSDIAEKVEKAKFGSPAVIVLGDVVRLRKNLRWFERKPLFGQTILVTRPKEQAEEFIRVLRQEGARVVSIPTIKIWPVKNFYPLDQALQRILHYSWVVFTSTNGVEQFLKRCHHLNVPPLELSSLRTCAIGPKTAERMRRGGLPVTRMAKEYWAEAILPELGEVKGARVLIPRARVARDLLIQELRKKGARVDVVKVYETKEDPRARSLIKKISREGIDWVTFTSSSTVINFMKLLNGPQRRRFFRRARAASIGPITSKTLRDFGIKPAVEASSYTTEGLAQALVRHHEAS